MPRSAYKKKQPKVGTQLSLARTGGVGGRRKGAGRKPAKDRLRAARGATRALAPSHSAEMHAA